MIYDMNFIFQYTHIYTTHTYNYIHILVSHCIINVIVYGLGGGCSLKAVLPNTPITINIYEKSGSECWSEKVGPAGHGVGEQVPMQSNMCSNLSGWVGIK